MRTILSLTLSALVFVFSALNAAEAMTVSPLQVEMNAVGQRANGRVTVVNNSDQPLPVEAVIERLTLDEMGKQTTQKAGEEFLIMPPQAMIPPGGTQNFRIQWLGDPMMDRSQSFMLFLNQIPVRMPKGKNGVQVVMGMGVMINVAPAIAAPALNVVGTGITTDPQGNRVASITVENPTTTHALMSQARVQIFSGNWSSTITPDQLADRVGIGLVQPGHRRKFTLPVALPPGIGKIDARVELAVRQR